MFRTTGRASLWKFSGRRFVSTRATADETAKYFSSKNIRRDLVRVNPITGFSVSAVGFGCYRVNDSNEGHQLALSMALRSGYCNVIDTSTNYAGGASERLVGKVVKELDQSGHVPRSQVVIISKAGYLQGPALEEAQLLEKMEQGYPEVVKVSQHIWYCMSPQFLEKQLIQSLKRLELPSLDVYLLHNPEYFLHAEYKSDLNAFYDRIDRALGHLEKEVSRGRIQFYGISSNNFPTPDSEPRHVSLARIMAIVKERGYKHFAAIQFPFNIFESGALIEKNNVFPDNAEEKLSVIELASKTGLWQLGNRPLNTITSGAVFRLANCPDHAGRDVKKELDEACAQLKQVEEQNPRMDLLTPWSSVFSKQETRRSLSASVVLWHDQLPFIENDMISCLRAIEDAKVVPSDWGKSYTRAAVAVLRAFTRFVQAENAPKLSRFGASLDSLLPKLGESEALSHKAIRPLLPIVDTVLVGMRRTEYVADVIRGLERPLLDEKSVRKFLEEVRGRVSEMEQISQ